MIRHLVVVLLAACSSSPTPEQACKNLEARCGEYPAFPGMPDCPSVLPKARAELSEADYTKFVRCVNDADSCGKALGCFGNAANDVGGAVTRSILDDIKKK